MSHKTFKNFKAARRHLSKIELNILAVDKCLKPSYLWDSFDAKIEEIQNYVDQLLASGKLEKKLSVFSVNDHIFITYLKNLETHLKLLLDSYYDVFLVDVSKKLHVPVPLLSSEKETILRLVVDDFYKHLLSNYLEIPQNNSSQKICNLTTLFGALLGYPVLYWYDYHWTSNSDDLTCLSMLPLTVHKVYASINNSCLSKKPFPRHELYSFSIPDMLLNQSTDLISAWLKEIQMAQSENCIFQNLEMTCDTVTLPYVVL